MNIHLKLKQCQIALLELQAENLKSGIIHVPSHVRWSLAGLGATAYIERKRYRSKREYVKLMRHIVYLKRRHYLERVKEGERVLYKLTAKGQYELLHLKFIFHMREGKDKIWNRKFYLVTFDIPEEKRAYRNFFRKLLKKNHFRMVQQSVWITPHNPHPVIDDLVKYFRLEKYFEFMEIECEKCSPRLRKRIGKV